MSTLKLSLFAAAALAAAVPVHAAEVVTGAATGSTQVRGFDTPGFGIVQDFPAYPGFPGGVRVAAGDVDGDNRIEIITAAGPGGGPHVKVFSGQSGAELRSFDAYGPSFTGGVFVAAGDVDSDGFADIVTGAGAGGGPHVKVFSGQTGAELSSFFAYGAGFTGGVRVAAGDLNGDGFADIVTGAGAGAPGGHVKVFDGLTGAELRSFFAFTPSFTGGVSVAAGDWGGVDALFVGAGAGAGGGHVKVFRLGDLSELASFFAFDPGFVGGVNVATGLFDGHQSLYVSMASMGGAVRVFDAARNPGALLGGFEPYGRFTGGVEIAASSLPPLIPEPATWATLILGFGIAGSAIRRRQVKPAPA